MININLSPSQKKIIKMVGYPLFYSVAFLIFLTLTFPGDRFIPMVEGKLGEMSGRKVSIDELSVSPLGSISLEGVRIKVPVKDGDKDDDKDDDFGSNDKEQDGKSSKIKHKPVSEYVIDEINVDMGILGLLFGNLSIDIDMDFLGGDVSLSYEGALPAQKNTGLSDDEKSNSKADLGNKDASGDHEPDDNNPLHIKFNADNLNLIQFVDLKDFLPMPLFGTISFGLDITTETGNLSDANGTVFIKGRHLSLGKGQSKVEVLEGMGPMTVDAMAISDLDILMKVKNGKCSFNRFKVVSNDIDITASGDVLLRDPFDSSQFNLYFAFKLLEGYANRSPNAKTLVSLMSGALPNAKRTDGYFGFLYAGHPGSAKFKPQKQFRSRSRKNRRHRPHIRRNLTKRHHPPVRRSVANKPEPPPEPSPSPPVVQAPVPPPVRVDNPPSPTHDANRIKPSSTQSENQDLPVATQLKEASLAAKEAMNKLQKEIKEKSDNNDDESESSKVDKNESEEPESVDNDDESSAKESSEESEKTEESEDD